MKRWVIIGAADIKNYDALKSKINEDDYIVAADGGQRHLEPLGVRPTFISAITIHPPNPKHRLKRLFIRSKKMIPTQCLPLKRVLPQAAKAL